MDDSVHTEQPLGTAERARAARFIGPAARRQFVQSRVALRRLLGRYLDLEPAQVPILIEPGGKPRLGPPYGALHFNLTHAGTFGLFAFVRGRPVGVDLEHLQPSRDLEGVAARFFAPEESAALRRLPQASSVDDFYRVWARREAALKALGLGLSAARAVGVSVAGSTDDWLIRVDGALSPGWPASSWLTRDLRVLPGYAAALAVPGGAGLRVCVHGGLTASD